MAQGFGNLVVWQKAYGLALETYKATSDFPKGERYGLVSQIRRAAISVPANIAEGYERNHRKEYIQFLAVAKGSLSEFETYLLFAKDLQYLPYEQYHLLENNRKETARMLTGLMRALKPCPMPHDP